MSQQSNSIRSNGLQPFILDAKREPTYCNILRKTCYVKTDCSEEYYNTFFKLNDRFMHNFHIHSHYEGATHEMYLLFLCKVARINIVFLDNFKTSNFNSQTMVNSNYIGETFKSNNMDYTHPFMMITFDFTRRRYVMRSFLNETAHNCLAIRILIQCGLEKSNFTSFFEKCNQYVCCHEVVGVRKNNQQSTTVPTNEQKPPKIPTCSNHESTYSCQKHAMKKLKISLKSKVLTLQNNDVDSHDRFASKIIDYVQGLNNDSKKRKLA